MDKLNPSEVRLHLSMLRAALHQAYPAESKFRWMADYADETMRYIESLEDRAPSGTVAVDYAELYNDLIMQVAIKYPGETRHESARRIIQQHQSQDNPPQAALAEKGE